MNPVVSTPPADLGERAWWRRPEPYHWFVLLVASGAWFFDTLDQRLFSLARIPALTALMHLPPGNVDVQSAGKIVTAFFLVGWAFGGVIFGPLGDRFGRARMLAVTTLIYSIFTGLSFFSQSRFDFTLFRFLTGLGVGGVFGLAVALIAETVPAGARVQSLGLLQILLDGREHLRGVREDGNRFAGVVARSCQRTRLAMPVPRCAAPALLVVFTARRLHEPEPWLRLKANGLLPKGSFLGPYARLLSQRRWRKSLIVGALIASTGVVGLWAIGEYAVDLQRAIFRTYYETHAAPSDVKSLVDAAISRTFLLNMIGAAVGMWLFVRLTAATGRRFAFAVGFGAALVITFGAYWKMNSPRDAYWMMPLMGAAQLGVFAGFSIYLPELFPSELLSTGVSFCYNIGRFAAAAGSFFSSVLTHKVFGSYPSPQPLRYAAMTMCAIFLIGLATLPFAPETRGQPLPE